MIMELRRIEFGKDWERHLNYLVLNKGLHFEEAWQYVLSLFDDIRDDS